jgi:hypothetical protein
MDAWITKICPERKLLESKIYNFAAHLRVKQTLLKIFGFRNVKIMDKLKIYYGCFHMKASRVSM